MAATPRRCRPHAARVRRQGPVARPLHHALRVTPLLPILQPQVGQPKMSRLFSKRSAAVAAVAVVALVLATPPARAGLDARWAAEAVARAHVAQFTPAAAAPIDCLGPAPDPDP